MRLTEILREDYSENLDSDLTNLLVNLKSRGATEIKIMDLVRQLRGMGYVSVDQNSIRPLLQANPVVMGIDNTNVTLKTSETVGGNESENSAEQVKKLAKKASRI